jgi:hypothetical protein
MQLKSIQIFVLLTILLSPFGGVGGGLYAQTGTISGRLKQDDGMPAIGARLFVYTIDGMGDERIIGFANTADDNDNNGKFVTEKIPVGVYTVHIKYPSYRKVIITGVPVVENKATVINLILEAQSIDAAGDTTMTYSLLAPKPVPPSQTTPVVDTAKAGDKKKKRKA